MFSSSGLTVYLIKIPLMVFMAEKLIWNLPCLDLDAQTNPTHLIAGGQLGFFLGFFPPTITLNLMSWF